MHYNGPLSQWRRSNISGYDRSERSRPAKSFGIRPFPASARVGSAATRSPTCCSIGQRRAASVGLRSAGMGLLGHRKPHVRRPRRVGWDIANKGDPAAEKRAGRNAETIAELCDLYLTDADAGRLITRRRSPKRASTLATDRGRIRRHIKPLLGRRAVASITREDVEAFLHDVAAGKTAGKAKTKPRGLAHVRGGRGTASRTVGLLGAIFSYAVRRRMRTDNPVHGVARPADGRRERRLSEDEYKALGKALRLAAAATIWPAAIAAARFLTLTGWRSGEALGLRWDEIDLARRTVILGDTKTGRSVRPLAHAACGLLRDLGRTGDLVFPATRGDGRMAGFPKLWSRIASFGDLPDDVTPHVFRHSFASLAADLGYNEPTIAALIGHKGQTMTSRYWHEALPV
jgi:integrase